MTELDVLLQEHDELARRMEEINEQLKDMLPDV
jgi:hypothetical protein